MAIHWYKNKNRFRKNRYFLHTICAGFVFFGSICLLSLFTDRSICPINYFFGRKCPGCGMTHAFRALLRMDLCSAFNHNPLSVPLFFGILVYFILGTADILFDKTYIIRFESFLCKKYMLILYALLFVYGLFSNNVL